MVDNQSSPNQSPVLKAQAMLSMAGAMGLQAPRATGRMAPIIPFAFSNSSADQHRCEPTHDRAHSLSEQVSVSHALALSETSPTVRIVCQDEALQAHLENAAVHSTLSKERRLTVAHAQGIVHYALVESMDKALVALDITASDILEVNDLFCKQMAIVEFDSVSDVSLPNDSSISHLFDSKVAPSRSRTFIVSYSDHESP
jgi:hypothetical protein